MKDLTADEPPSKARLRLWLRLLRVTRGIEAGVRERLRSGHDTTLPRFDVMAALYRTPDGLRMSELSGQLRVSNGNVTGIVQRLVNDGAIERAPVPGDRRAMQVRLTPVGRAEFAAMAGEHERWIDAMLSGIDPKEATAMAAALRHIADTLDERTAT